jgi:glycine betaine/proline transport system permease protein
MPSWLTEFPQLDRTTLVDLRRGLDQAYRGFSREFGAEIEAFFDPLLFFLVWFERLLINAPWWVVIAAVCALVWALTRSWKLIVGVAIAFLLIGFFGMWEDTMSTLAIITVCTLVSIVLGVPIGIVMARSNRVQMVVMPILDVMQTMPAFVYLIPVVMLLGIGKVPGVLMAGVNQTIMMALAMVVIAAMIGVKGLGQPVLQSITNQYFTQGLLNGLAIVALAIVFDRVSQAYGKRMQKHRGSAIHG